MRSYAELMRVPGVFGVTSAQLFARLPLGMISLAILLHVQSLSGSYALAGGVVACVSVGEAIVMPMTARLAGAMGIRTVLLATAIINAAAMVMLAFVPPHPGLLVPLGLIVGASIPPIMPVLRALYPQMVRADSLRALFALDTTAQEIIWIVGPVVATLLTSAISTAIPLVASAFVTIAGTVWLTLNRPIRTLSIERNESSFGRALAARAVVLAMVASLALVASFMALEVAIIADFGEQRTLAGLGLGLSGFGSLVGGLFLGHRRLSLGGLVATMAVVAVGTGLAGIAPDRGLQFVALFFAGFGFAPAMSTLYVAASRAVKPEAASEVFGWLNTGALAGAALGTAIAGVMKDSIGLDGAFATAMVLAVIAALSPIIATVTGPIHELST